MLGMPGSSAVLITTLLLPSPCSTSPRALATLSSLHLPSPCSSRSGYPLLATTPPSLLQLRSPCHHTLAALSLLQLRSPCRYTLATLSLLRLRSPRYFPSGYPLLATTPHSLLLHSTLLRISPTSHSTR